MKYTRAMTRRSFVAGTAAFGAAAALCLSACTPAAESKKGENSETEVFDAVIVGGGLSGMMAAITLCSDHAERKVLLLESQESLGGSLKYSDGYFIGFSDRYNTDPTDCATAMQMENMIINAADDVVDHGYAAMQAPLDETLVRSVFGEMSDTISDLLDMGVPFQTPLDTASPFSTGAYADDVYAVGTDGLGVGFSTAVIDQLEKSGVEVRVSSRVEDLIVEDGVVVGTKVVSGKREYDVRASAVLLATGGFAASKEKLEEHLGQFKDCVFYPNPGATGAAIDLTRRFDTPLVSDGIFGGVNAADETFTITACHFLVNNEGKRFTDESQNWYIMLWPVVQNTKDASGWCVCDADYVAANPKETEYKIEAGTLVEYESIEALCLATGIDRSGLEESIALYNDAIDAGIDPEFGLPVGEAHAIQTPPFYAEKTTSWCFGTIKGIEVDANCRVLAGDGVAIPGLYATGEAAAGNVFFGQYPGGGSGNSLAGNFGRFAAEVIAASLGE